jgi:hypothetical protein
MEVVAGAVVVVVVVAVADVAEVVVDAPLHPMNSKATKIRFNEERTNIFVFNYFFAGVSASPPPFYSKENNSQWDMSFQVELGRLYLFEKRSFITYYF